MTLSDAWVWLLGVLEFFTGKTRQAAAIIDQAVRLAEATLAVDNVRRLRPISADFNGNTTAFEDAVRQWRTHLHRTEARQRDELDRMRTELDAA